MTIFYLQIILILIEYFLEHIERKIDMGSMGRSTDLWPWYKEILATVESALVHKQPGSRAKLEMVLHEAEKDFKDLLQNPAPNSADAASLRKAVTDGISLPSKRFPYILE